MYPLKGDKFGNLNLKWPQRWITNTNNVRHFPPLGIFIGIIYYRISTGPLHEVAQPHDPMSYITHRTVLIKQECAGTERHNRIKFPLQIWATFIYIYGEWNTRRKLLETI